MAGALDEFLPIYQHRERHQRIIAAPPARVWDAIFRFSSRDVPVSRFLMDVRSIPQTLVRRKSDDRPSDQPLLETFLKAGFRELRADPSRLFIAGAAIQPWRLVRGQVADLSDGAGFRSFNRPGFVLAAISFELEALQNGTRLATETRVQPTDRSAARAFLPYWVVIRAGSGVIRREMLRAVARRAEA